MRTAMRNGRRAGRTLPRLRARVGVTLVEVIIGLVLAAIVGGGVTAILSSQQRFYMRASSMLDARSQVRQAMTLLPADLAPISPADGDLLSMSDTEIDMMTTIGAGLACSATTAAGVTVIDLPPTREDAAARVGFTADPQVGDAVAMLDDATGNYTNFTVTAVSSGATVCATGGFADLGATGTRWRLTLSGAATAGNVAGMPIRVTRRVKYSLYQDATDSKWYLGRQVAGAGVGAALGTRTMVAGPYVPTSTTGAGGIMMRYRTSAGALTTTPSAVARVDITVRGDSVVTAKGRVRSSSDSISISLRNRF